MSVIVYTLLGALTGFAGAATRRRGSWVGVSVTAAMFIAATSVMMWANNGHVLPWLATGVVAMVVVYGTSDITWGKARRTHPH